MSQGRFLGVCGEEELREIVRCERKANGRRHDAVGGGKREMKGKKRDRKFSPGQTNKNALIPHLPRSIFLP